MEQQAARTVKETKGANHSKLNSFSGETSMAHSRAASGLSKHKSMSVT